MRLVDVAAVRAVALETVAAFERDHADALAGAEVHHVGAPVSNQEAVPELLDHWPTLPSGARALRNQDNRSCDLPSAGRPGAA